MSHRRQSGPHTRNPNAPRGVSTGLPWPIDPGPTPGPEPEPVPHWVDSAKHLVFAGVPLPPPLDNPALGDPGGTLPAQRALWASPVFDLRPDLGGNYRPTATRIPGAARLHVQMRRADGAFLTTIPSAMEVYSIESAHVANPQELRFMEERLDISSDFYQGTESSVLEWAPPGAPLRFWRVTIVFDWFDAFNDPPRLVCWGSAH